MKLEEKVEKEVLFFDRKPPKNQTAIHLWLGKETYSHDEHLNQILKEYLGVSVFKLATSPKGKRYLPDFPLHFNLSDSDGWLAIAFSWETPIGIDIESMRPIEGMNQIIHDSFSPDEQAYVQFSDEDKVSRFWEIWSRKEACLKALGIGLQDEMSQWDCFGNGWVNVNKTWVKSIPVNHPLSVAIAISP